jgi:hypothetical protein
MVTPASDDPAGEVQVTNQGTPAERPAEESPLDAETGEEGRAEVITEAYVKIAVVQWEWPKVIGMWLVSYRDPLPQGLTVQRNALGPFVHSDAITRNDGHPLCQPDEESVCLYNGETVQR